MFCFWFFFSLCILGMVKYPGTEMWMPAVFGMKIPDPGGSSLMVPILGIDCDRDTRQPSPLAGTMEDGNGKGKPGNSI